MAADLLASQPNLSLTLASGEALDVRTFAVEEGLSRLFEVRLTAVSPSVDVDFEAAIGGPARFEVRHTSSVDGQTRHWGGICEDIEQTAVEESGLSSYAVRIVPRLWLLGQRRNYRVFQDLSELDVVLRVLSGWGMKPELRVDAGAYGARRYRVQYGESDLDFVSRLLEDVGVTYFFDQAGGETVLVLADAPGRGASRAPLPFVSKPSDRLQKEYVTAVSSHRRVRPGRHTQSDVDWRRALDYPLAASAAGGGSAEASLERYHHNYGSFLWKAEGGGDTPVADDRGPARTSETRGAAQVKRRLEAQRADARVCRFRTTAYDLRPGQVMTIVDHPRGELGAPLLVVGGAIRGSATGEWEHDCEAAFTDVDHRPRLATPRPRTSGVESATVTGPAGEEIHTDELGRVRVHFHWDREGSSDETSSCWIPVSQPWAGAGMGSICLPRVGQEVIVDFLGADPDRPIVLGGVYTTTNPPLYALPTHKMVSGMRSETYPRRKAPAASAGHGGGPTGGGLPLAPLGGGPSDSQDISRQAPGADAIKRSVRKTKADSPDAQDVSRDANGIVFNDRAERETLYIQAQRHLRIMARNDLSGVVGGTRVFTVLADDSEHVLRRQKSAIGKVRTVEVGGDQCHSVVGDIHVVTQENHLLTAKDGVISASSEGAHEITSAKLNLLTVGEDTKILMLPDAIVFEAAKVFINPGATFVSALENGRSLEQAAAATDEELSAEAAARKLALDKEQAALEGEGKKLHEKYASAKTMQERRERAETYKEWQESRAQFEKETGRTVSDPGRDAERAAENEHLRESFLNKGM